LGTSTTPVGCGYSGDNEVQRTMLEIVNQLDGFEAA
jgi:ATP-dependent 26S proteasome regulatory subunit